MLSIIIFTVLVAASCGAQYSVEPCRVVHERYYLTNVTTVVNMGCYNSRGDAEILPRDTLQDLSAEARWLEWNNVGYAGNAIMQCGQMARRSGYMFFGVKSYTECYFGHGMFTVQGEVKTDDNCAAKCSYDLGGYEAMMVFWIDPRVVTPGELVGQRLFEGI